MEVNPILSNFKQNVIYLVKVLQNLVIENKDKIKDLPDPSILAAGLAVLESANAIKLIFTFIEHSFKYWNEIKAKNKDFFINRAEVIFGGFAKFKDKISTFKSIFTSDIVSADLYAILFRKFRQMVRQSISYSIEKMGEGKTISFGEVKISREQILSLKNEWDPTKEEDKKEEASKEK